MANMKYVQWTPIAPLNLLGRIDATVTSPTAPARANQLAMAENTDTNGFVMDLVLLQLVAI
jgi:hypothetical protein